MESEKMIFKENDNDELLFEEIKNFIIENYPVSESGYDIEELISGGLDGKEVIEKKDRSEDLEAILTYDINTDKNNITYCSIGIMLTREESKREGLMKELIAELKELSDEKNCEYIVAVPDTQEGQDSLSHLGFYAETDSVNGREYLRLDL